MDAFSRNGSENANTTVIYNDAYTHAAIYEIVLIILSVLIGVSNATVLLLYYSNPRIRSTKNVLLASLALSDLCAGTTVIPITLKCFEEYTPNKCIASSILFRFIAFSTILHILGIILEKYVSILHPFCVVHKKHLRILSVCIWSVSFVVAALPLAWLDIGNQMDDEQVRKELVYFVVTFIGFFVTPFVLIVFAQIRMLKVISRSFKRFSLTGRDHFEATSSPKNFSHVERFNLSSPNKPLRFQRDAANEPESQLRISSTHNRKVITAFALMLATFTVCWLTWYLGVFLSYVNGESFRTFSADLKQMFQVLVFLPSLINPLLYTYYKHDFRQALQGLLEILLKMFCS